MIQKAKESFVKVYNLIVRELAYTTQIDHSGKHIPYFQGNDTFPVELSALVQGSPTATSCLSTLTDFITGEGFNNPDLENLKVNNQGLKFFQFHNICAGSMAHKWGVASIVKYNQAGQVLEFYDIPFGYCRLGVPDGNGVISKIKYNPYFGTSLYKQKDTVEYDVYNPKEALTQGGKNKNWKGQIFWMAIRDEKHPFYPVPDYYSAKAWMNVEKNAGIYFDENLSNGFLQSTIIKMLGNPNDDSGLNDKDGNAIPKGKAFDDEMSKNFQGTERVAKIMAFWADGKDEFPTLEAFPTSGNPDMYRVQDEHATKKITIATKVPAILANISEGVSLGGDGNTIRASVKLMQQRVVRPQSILIDYYQELLRNFHKPITEPIRIVPYHPFPELETVDPQAWEVLTTEEKRKWVNDHTEIELIEAEEPVTAQQQQQNSTATAQAPVALHFNNYPKEARENAQRAIDWQLKNNSKCQAPFSLDMSVAIAKNTPLGPAEIRRISNFLSKKVLAKDKEWSLDCDAVRFYGWGGSEMMLWVNDKKKELKGETD